MAPNITDDSFRKVQPLFFETTEALAHRLAWKKREYSYKIVSHQPRLIAYRLVRVSNPRGAFVIGHGYGESSIRYEALAAELNRLGFSVFLFDFSGYGYSRRPPKPGRIRKRRIRKYSRQTGIPVNELEATLELFLSKMPKDHEVHFYGHYRDGAILCFQEYVDDLLAAINKAKVECQTENLYLFSHSQAGLITEIALRQLGSKACEIGIKGAVLSSPAFKLEFNRRQKLKAWIAGLVSRIPCIACRFGLDSGITVADLMSKAPPEPAKDENREAKLTLFLQLAQGQIVEIARARWFTELLSAQDEYWTWLQEADSKSPCFEIPTLFLYGTNDPLVSIRRIKDVYNCCRTKNPRSFQLAHFDGRHEIIQDACRSEVFAVVERWSNEVAPRHQAGV